MINIINNEDCCGCAACYLICPKHCITMQADQEGFLYPHVDKQTCVDCGLCEKVCHELHPYDERKPLKVLAAINKDEKIRMQSSSGGIFYVLAEKIIQAGGVVFGACFDEQWQVIIDYTETMEGVKAFMGSKYVQARIEQAYRDAKQLLSEGRQVLFSGTPCQIAGLHHFLQKPYDNLLTVDIICHGVPSPKVWGLYLDEVIRESQRINQIEFRNKKNGWKRFGFRMAYNEGDQTVSLLTPFREDPFMKAFLQDLILRPSCYDCKAKSGRSHSDITIADFWGIQTIFPEMDDDKGTGLVFLNTDKGIRSLDTSNIHVEVTEYDRIKHLNPACFRSPHIHPRRTAFFNQLDQSSSVISWIEVCTRPTLKQRMISVEYMCKRLVKRMLKGIGGGKIKNSNNPIFSSMIHVDYEIPADPTIVSIRFRNKQQGWKSYRLEIRIK